MAAHGRGAMPLARNVSRSLDGNTIRSSPDRTVSGWKVEKGFEDGKRSFGRAQPEFGRAKVLEHEPFVGRGLRGAVLGGHLACDVGKRQRSPPEGRRRKNGFHVFVPCLRQKNPARQTGPSSLDRNLRKPYFLRC